MGKATYVDAHNISHDQLNFRFISKEKKMSVLPVVMRNMVCIHTEDNS